MSLLMLCSTVVIPGSECEDLALQSRLNFVNLQRALRSCSLLANLSSSISFFGFETKF